MNYDEFEGGEPDTLEIDQATAEEFQSHMIHGYLAISAAAIGAALIATDGIYTPNEFIEASLVEQITVMASIGIMGSAITINGIHKYLPSKTMAIVGGALIGHGMRTDQPYITTAGLCIAGTGIMSYLYWERQRLEKERKI